MPHSLYGVSMERFSVADSVNLTGFLIWATDSPIPHLRYVPHGLICSKLSEFYCQLKKMGGHVVIWSFMRSNIQIFKEKQSLFCCKILAPIWAPWHFTHQNNVLLRHIGNCLYTILTHNFYSSKWLRMVLSAVYLCAAKGAVSRTWQAIFRGTSSLYYGSGVGIQ